VAALLLFLSVNVRANEFEGCNNENPARTLQQGDRARPQSSFCLGLAYASGKGIGKNMAQAVYYFRRAADHGYGPAQAILGVHYEKEWE